MPPDQKQSLSTTIPKLALTEDDDDDNLDDLDDVIDQFSPSSKVPDPPPNTTTSLQPPPNSITGRPRTNTRVDAPPHSLPGSSASKLTATVEDVDEDKLGEDFAKELAKNMESLMRDLREDLGVGKEQDEAGEQNQEGEMTEEEKQKVLNAAWEALLVEGLAATGEEKVAAESEKESPVGGTYQERLKQAMDKIKEGESKLQSSSASGSSSTIPGNIPPDLESLLRSLGDPSTEPGEEEKEFVSFLETMMHQLMSKEVLYDPLKELAQGFPGYLSNPPTPLSEADLERFKNQQSRISKILAIFDNADYRDAHPEYSKQIIELMGEMQSYGSPPSEIMGPLPPGLEGLDSLKLGAGPGDEGCLIS